MKIEAKEIIYTTPKTICDLCGSEIKPENKFAVSDQGKDFCSQSHADLFRSEQERIRHAQDIIGKCEHCGKELRQIDRPIRSRVKGKELIFCDTQHRNFFKWGIKAGENTIPRRVEQKTDKQRIVELEEKLARLEGE